MHRAFHGHEGPVNAVGVQGNRLASASGDGKMILWDMKSGERLRTFDAHDRGLACIEFKVRSCHVIVGLQSDVSR
jgi:F-box and WD-40 domain protein 1/11